MSKFNNNNIKNENTQYKDDSLNSDDKINKNSEKSKIKSKKRKGCKIALITVLSIILVVISSFVFILQAPYSYANDGLCEQDNFDIISSITNIVGKNPKINEIAMLGSHDSFSLDITSKSMADPAETGVISNSFVRSMLGQFQVRYSITQTVGALYQLNAGTRYFDIRLSNVDGEWWTKHGVLSGKFETYLKEILQFLDENNGETIILDFQHVYVGDNSISDLFDYLGTVKVNEKSIFDYITYSTFSSENNFIEFSELRYNDLTQNGEKSGVVMFVDYNELAETMSEQTSVYKNKFYNRYQNVRSLWHNSNNGDYIINKIDEEAQLLATTDTYSDCLRINQTQNAVQFALSGIPGDIGGWSLLNIAENHNIVLLNSENFYDWLEVMPVFMVDFVSSTKGDFNNLVNQKIKTYNDTLCSNL